MVHGVRSEKKRKAGLSRHKQKRSDERTYRGRGTTETNKDEDARQENKRTKEGTTHTQGCMCSCAHDLLPLSLPQT
jgi:hypothetical protein